MLKTLALLSLLNLQPAPDSVTGSWQIKGDVVGNPVEEICTITETDAVITGNCSDALGAVYPVTGGVKEGKITFQHGGEYDGQTLTIIFSGTLSSPTAMKGTIQVQPFDAWGEFTATAVKNDA